MARIEGRGRWRGIAAIGAAVLFAFVVAGCAAYERAEEAGKVKSQMVGMRADQVRACAGPPRRTQRRGDDQIWIYETGDDDVRRGPDTTLPGAGGSSLPSASGLIPRRYCVARVFLRGGQVRRVTYSGTTGGVFSRGEQCAFVLGNCAK